MYSTHDFLCGGVYPKYAMLHDGVNYCGGSLAIMMTMFAKHAIADVASLLADPGRVAMLTALFNGESRPAGELARIAHLSPQAASAHLAKLTAGELLTVVREGRHHYYRIAKPEVGVAIEALAVVNRPPRPATIEESEETQALRLARTCYDHLAGRVAVRIVDSLIRMRALRGAPQEFILTPSGERLLKSFDIDVSILRQKRRPFASACLDWTERRHHLAGSLGAALLSAFCSHRWLARRAGNRAMRLTDCGRQEIGERLGLQL